MEVGQDQNDSFHTIHDTLKYLKLEQYEEDFKSNEVTDDLMKYCIISGDLNFWKDLIPIKGHQMKFKREFCARAGIQETKMTAVGTAAEASVSSQEITRFNSAVNETKAKKSQSVKFIDVLSMARACGWPQKAKRAVWKKINAACMTTFDDVIQERQKAVNDYFEDEDLERLIDEALEASTYLFDKYTDCVYSYSEKLNQRKILTQDLEEKVKQVKDKNNNNRKNAHLNMENEATHIIEGHITWIRENLGDGFISSETLQEIFEERGLVAQQDFEDHYGKFKCYDAELFYDMMEAALNKLRNEISAQNAVPVRAESLSDDVKRIYEGFIINFEGKQFEQVHASMVAKIEEAFAASTYSIDENIQHYIQVFNQYFNQLHAEVISEIQTRIEFQAEKMRKVYLKSLQHYFNSVLPLISKGLFLGQRHLIALEDARRYFRKIIEELQDSYKLRGEDDGGWNGIGTQSDSKNQDGEQRKTDRSDASEAEIQHLTEISKHQYIKEMEKFNDSAWYDQDFEEMESTVLRVVIKEFEEKLNVKIPDASVMKEHVEYLSDKLSVVKAGLREIFNISQKKNEIGVKAALIEAERLIERQMQEKFQSDMWIEPLVLETTLEDIITIALEKSQKKVLLTNFQKLKLKAATKFICKKYQESNQRRHPDRPITIGIDFGETYSRVGVFVKNKLKFIVNKVTRDTAFPNYQPFQKNGWIFFAFPHDFRYPVNTICHIKRLIGRKLADVQSYTKISPYEVLQVNGELRMKLNEKEFRPEELAAEIFSYLKEMAEKELASPVAKAVITVPAGFDDAQRNAIKEAANIANLEAVILDEPKAAVIAYQLHRAGDLRKNILIFELGVRVNNVSISTVEEGSIQIRATRSNANLGGIDFDTGLLSALIERVEAKYGIDLGRDRNSSDMSKKLKVCNRLLRLESSCERLKKNLSYSEIATIKIDELDGKLFLKERFTRKEFEQINMERFKTCIDAVARTLAEVKLTKTDIDGIILVGGSTRIPKVQEMLKEFFDHNVEFIEHISPERVVACGAAYYAALL